MPGNESLVALFRELVQLTTLDEGDPNSFRVRAYERAMEALALQHRDLAALSEKELTQIDGIGASTAKKIREYFGAGRISKLDELRQKYPPEFVELSRVPGLGPKTLRRLRDTLGVRNVADLQAAIAGQKLRELKGLGEKTEEKLRQALARIGTGAKQNRRPIEEAMSAARELVRALEKVAGVERVQYCGSLRRLRETIADLDVLVASREPAAVWESLSKLPGIAPETSSGDTKASLRTATGMQVDVRVVEPRSFGAACQYFTGSKAHNIRLRQRALARGFLLNEYGLTDTKTGDLIASESEEAIYRALDLPLIPAPMREDRGEIELAETGELPPEIRLADARGDLHVHTTLSGDGRSPLEDMLQAAVDRGYEYVAITDHAEDLSMNGVSREKLGFQRAQIEGLRARFPELAVLHGVELNIGRDGGLDYDAEFRRTLDWCVAGVHSLFDLEPAQQTRRVLAAMEDPTVNCIAHLTGRKIGHRPGIELDVDAVLRKAAETGTALEINAALGRLDASADVLWRARGMDVVFVISTDAHHVLDLERMQWGVQQATRGWLDPSRIANLWPRERLLEWVRRRRATA